MRPSHSNNLYLIGCGGVGSWLAPSLALLTSPRRVICVDGDTIEPKNLNRQLFAQSEIGRNKAEALADKYQLAPAHSHFYHSGTFQHLPSDWLICVVDNHRARHSALQACDIYGCRAIFAANEKFSAEAYYFQPAWKNTTRDPRIYYPEILTDQSGDPMARAIGCTGAAQVETPQLGSANFMAGALAQHLFVLWAMEAPSLAAETIPSLPYKLSANLTRLEFDRVGNL